MGDREFQVRVPNAPGGNERTGWVDQNYPVVEEFPFSWTLGFRGRLILPTQTPVHLGMSYTRVNIVMLWSVEHEETDTEDSGSSSGTSGASPRDYDNWLEGI
jgi:hypothetical protein